MTWLLENWHWIVVTWVLLIVVFCWFWYLLRSGATHYPDIHDVCLEREHVFREKGLWYWRELSGYKRGPYLDAASAYRDQISYLTRDIEKERVKRSQTSEVKTS